MLFLAGSLLSELGEEAVFFVVGARISRSHECREGHGAAGMAPRVETRVLSASGDFWTNEKSVYSLDV